ncbi:hypothetical protein BJ875DRAFT_237371 [Amylocarpus encephaloides]|uniref:GPI anchored protein n=1 Tax=Amylocarpus encephaloides TaxID=45428 RepID=A0A9P7YN12_9HELO|nr:hypothetical protein BJ875DRAFT_237371 [Amylocarpus encephaloides]
MRPSSILDLPSSMLFLIASLSTCAEPLEATRAPGRWQSDLEVRANDQPGSSIHRRRAAEEHLRMGRSPIGVMKMSGDEGEKFYMEYWQFQGNIGQSSSPASPVRPRDDEEVILLANGSMAIPFRAPLALHLGHELEDYQDLRAREAAVLAILEKREFTCPTGYLACAGIGFPNSCCAANENCFSIQDTGLGPVGCCPKGVNCGGTISQCNSPNTPCAQDLGGGCCIPKYVCQGVGCVLNSTVVVAPAPPTSTSSSIVAAPTTPSTTSVSTTAPVTTSVSTSTSVIPSTTPTTSRTVIIPTSTATGVPPVRPTSMASGTTSTTTELPGTYCPTGFYACSAHYDGGCCQIGRDCAKISCPTTSSTTLISSGQTIVVPVGAAATVATPTGTCATGWSTCAASIGGNCCPSGWDCGTASCTSLSPTNTEVVQKASPNIGVKRGVNVGACLGVVLVGSWMML